jgi:putative ABC transport system permease protein
MMRLLRDLGRRRLRTALTILGITIGIWSLVVFGSMANKIDEMVAGGSKFYAGKVTATAKGGVGFVRGPLAVSTADRIAHLDGVDVVAPSIAMLLSDDSTGLTMGQQMIVGGVAGADRGREAFVLHPADGRLLTAADEGANVAVLGSDLARQAGTTVGDSVTLRGEAFRVVGILEPTLTAPDLTAMVPLAAAQRLYARTLPTIVAADLDPTTIVSGLTVYPRIGVDPEAVAATIRAAEPDLEVMTAGDFDRQIGSATTILDSILVGIALISLAVGGLSVINTMAMSVAERTREIGIKRAIGGSRRRIVGELVSESALIGLLGGVVGLALGAVLVAAANEAGRGSGMVLFLLTPWTGLTAVVFATVLGALAGLVPALHAARLDPVAALRYE